MTISGSTLERLRVLRVPSPLVRPFVTAVRRTDHLDVVLVEATDADGRVGWGEAATSWRVTGESPQSVAAAVAGPLADATLGREAGGSDVAALISRSIWGNAAARSAVECALADLAARQAGVSLGRALEAHPSGAVVTPGSGSIFTDMTLSAAGPSELARRAAEHVAEGFRCLKVKAAADQDALVGVRAVRAEVGSDIVLRVDANQAWDAETAIRIIRAWEDDGLAIEFVEQPVPAHDLAGMARIVPAVGTPIMADESVRTAGDVRAVAERGAAHLVNIKLAKTGGLREAVAAVGAARDAGLGFVIGCMMEAHVGVSAAAHLASTFAPDAVHDLDAALWLRRSPVVGGVTATAGTLHLGSGAGIGVDGLAPEVEAEVLVDVRRPVEVHA
jgi:L-alanine-DL-glutamate epimerase-like enolase superfamily enzyme